MPVQRLTPAQALQKLKHYCAYQERSHSEVKEKAYGFGLHRQEVDEVISALIQEDYLNEERFAVAFAGGKFRMKGWGRVKIKYELKQRKVSEYCIRKALQEIDESVYQKTLEGLAKKKWNSIRGAGTNGLVKMSKTRDYLMQRGFEAEKIRKVLTTIGNKE